MEALQLLVYVAHAYHRGRRVIMGDDELKLQYAHVAASDARTNRKRKQKRLLGYSEVVSCLLSTRKTRRHVR